MRDPIQSLKRICRANFLKWKAIRKAEEIIARELRPGDRLAYSHGENLIECEYLRPCGEDVWVRGRRGTEYRIGAYRIEVIYRSQT